MLQICNLTILNIIIRFFSKPKLHFKHPQFHLFCVHSCKSTSIAWSGDFDSAYFKNILESVTKRKAGQFVVAVKIHMVSQGSPTVQFTTAEFIRPKPFDIKATALTHL